MKPLPHDAHAERVFLAGILAEPDANAAAFTLVAVADLYGFAHRLVYAAALELWSSYLEVSVADVYRRLWMRGQIRDLGLSPAVYLWELFLEDPAGEWCLHAAHRVLSLSMDRAAIVWHRERLGELLRVV